MLRSLLHLSGRLLRPPNPRFPGRLSLPLPTRPRFLSSSSPTPGGAGGAAYDYDPLIDRLCASASDTPVECDAWVVYDPVSGRIVVQEPPLSPPPTKVEEEREGAGERDENAGVKEKEKGNWKGKRTSRKGLASGNGEEGRIRRSSVAAAQKSAGNGGKESVSFVCSYCGEVDSQWWGNCRHCKARGTLQRCRDTVLQGVNIAIRGPPLSSSFTAEEEEGEGAGEREGEENAGVKEKKLKWKGKGKGKSNRKGRASASGEEGQTSRKKSVPYMCSHCGESHSQWWGLCRHCNAIGTLQKSWEMVLQGVNLSFTAAEEEEEEEGEGAGEHEGEENAGLQEKEKDQWKSKRKGRASATGEEGPTGRSSVAVERKSAGKGGKARVSYVCSHCGKVHPRWWGYCHHCKVPGTIHKSREVVLQSLQEVNVTIQRPPLSSSSTVEEEGEGAGEP